MRFIPVLDEVNRIEGYINADSILEIIEIDDRSVMLRLEDSKRVSYMGLGALLRLLNG